MSAKGHGLTVPFCRPTSCCVVLWRDAGVGVVSRQGFGDAAGDRRRLQHYFQRGRHNPGDRKRGQNRQERWEHGVSIFIRSPIVP